MVDCNRMLWHSRKALRHQLHPWRGERVTILVPGVQRSGTNMMMDIFDRSWETEVLHETDARAFDRFHLRPLIRQKALRDKSQARFFVLKALLDSHMTVEMLSYLAPARTMWIYRHFDDMVNSNLRAWPGGRNQIEALMTDPYRTGYRVRGMTPETLATIRDLYHPGLDDGSAIALFWYYRNQLYFDQGLDRDPRAVLVKYEDIATSPRATIAWICEKLGMQYRDEFADAVHQKSIGKRHPPLIEPEIRALCQNMLARLEQGYRQSRPA